MSDPRTPQLATPIRPVQAPAAASPWPAAVPPVLGAWLGGTFVGLLESLYLLARSPTTHDYSGVLWALLAYGVVGAVGGLVPAAIALLVGLVSGQRPEPARSWTLGFLSIALGFGAVVGLQVLGRDAYFGAPVPSGARLWLAAGLGVFALAFYLVVRNALAKTLFRFLLAPLGTTATWVFGFLFFLAIALGQKLANDQAQDLAARPVPPSLQDAPNLLLVVVDSLRADALGVYRAPGDPSPALDRLAADGVVFEQAISHAPSCRSSFASLLTSLMPCVHGCTREADGLADGLETVAEVLQRQGYTTGALVSGIDVTASFNFHQGFDTFDFLRPAWTLRASEASFRLTLYRFARWLVEGRLRTEHRVAQHYRDASDVTDATLQWLGHHGQGRWFLVVHYMDLHEPWFAHPPDGTAFSRLDQPRPGAGEDAEIARRYEGEVRHWDGQLQRLMAWMDNQGLLDTTAVVVTSDHGVELGDHGGFWSGEQLYDEVLRVPLVLRLPDAQADTGRRVGDQVRLIDLAPTLTQLAGAPAPDAWQGVSLLREYELRDADQRLALSEVQLGGRSRQALRDRDWKLIVDGSRSAAAGSEELYFLQVDPLEQTNLAGERSARGALEQRRDELQGLRLAVCGGGSQEGGPGALSREQCEQLRALGYIDVGDGRCGPP